MQGSSQVLRSLQALQKVYKDQNFIFTKDQQERYDELLMLRRAFIQHWKENNFIATSK
jgi:hypothetical protein